MICVLKFSRVLTKLSRVKRWCFNTDSNDVQFLLKRCSAMCFSTGLCFFVIPLFNLSMNGYDAFQFVLSFSFWAWINEPLAFVLAVYSLLNRTDESQKQRNSLRLQILAGQFWIPIGSLTSWFSRTSSAIHVLKLNVSFSI